ncbi:DNA polymerase III subunit delta' [Allopusillimonas ginsengisoli]|uniref:DNA polymerase III subunit delta' n=1 Tax=Allopusillimonas ginsengisoli TaxID=453575 RepID=UPI00101ED4AA|nr:DNA polymerase III subunit delta' [Allopusillimonas ginsengisoli]TEA77615.1 DNA polymerase III subunit delta' [Allopusillimonas ginsengisoli]
MSALPDFLPWQRELAQQWLNQRERFAHAWLLHGLPGIGKKQFALAAAASLLCEQPANGLACGTCPACLWVAGGNHPDLRRIRPDAVAQEEGVAVEEDTSVSTVKKTPSRDIRVEQLRALGSWFNTATHRGGWRVAVLYPARAMNMIAANALLKVLEEPPEHTVFLLVADAPDRLLPTLVSRCRRLPLPVPDPAQSLAWLQAEQVSRADEWLAAAGGAPLLAKALSLSNDSPCPDWLQQLTKGLAGSATSDIGPLADQIEKLAPDAWIDSLQRLFVDILLAASEAQVRYYPALESHINTIAAQASRQHLGDTARWLTQQRRIAGHPLNAKLFTHSALQRVALACNPVRQP